MVIICNFIKKSSIYIYIYIYIFDSKLNCQISTISELYHSGGGGRKNFVLIVIGVSLREEGEKEKKIILEIY
jgi:hypothetical protein